MNIGDMIRLRFARIALALICSSVFSCSGSQRALPAPEYREPQLPAWEAEPQQEQEFDLEGALESGEWVEENSPAMGGAPPESSAPSETDAPAEPAVPAAKHEK